MSNPADILEKWVALVNAGDVEKLLGLYDRQAILIPTFADQILQGPEALQTYFQQLGQRENLSVHLQDQPVSVTQLDQHIWALGGFYDWHFKEQGVMQICAARFSYIIDLSKAGPILHHHSSQTPII